MKTTLFTLSGLCMVLLVGSAYSLMNTPQQAARIPVAGTKIPIDPKRWYQLNNTSNGLEGLFDGVTNVNVNTGYGKILANYDAYYPLLAGETFTIESLRFFDFEGSNTEAPVTVSIITDKWQRIPIARFIGDKYNQWVGPDPASPDNFSLKTPISGARYLVLNTSGAYPTEMELYGSYQAGQTPSAAATRPTPFKQAAGVNVYEWNFEDGASPLVIDETKMPAIKSFAAVRHYMDWEKLEPAPGEYTFNPTTSGSWNYDVIYERCQAEGIDVLACLKTIPNWMQETYPTDQRDGENVPARYGADLSSPTSYIEQAKVGFQYIARYGMNKNVDPALVKVSTTKTWAGLNTVKIGLGLIHYIECDNERDKWWKGRKAYQTGREYAANLSAFYDGHKNSLGPGVGVKNADPAVQVVIGGLAASSTDYVRAMIDWCREFRGYKENGQVNLCWDVINQHLYANDAKDSQNGEPTRGMAPELAGIGEQAAAFVTLSHQFANDVPVWITEVGYDVNQGSPLRAIPIGRKSALETQADWTLRTSLLFTRIGIDRVFFFQLYDDNPQNPNRFSSMGLANADASRRPASDYLFQTYQLLGDFRYKETLNADPLVDRYELNGQSAYALLIPDEKGRTGTYQLAIPKGDTVQLCTPAIGRTAMNQTVLVSQTGTITIKVSETPVFVIPNRLAPPEEKKSLTTLLIYPNPTADFVTLNLNNEVVSPINVTIYDNAGRRCKQISFTKLSRSFSEQVDLSTLPTGQYLLEVRQEDIRVVKKIIRTP